MTSKLSIVFMLDYVEFGGGATRMMLWVASSAAKLGCKVEVCSISHSDFLETNMSSSCKYHSFDAPLRTARQKRNPIEESKLIARIYSYMESIKPDIVVSFGGHEFYYAFLLKFICGYRLCISERTDPYHPRSIADTVRRKLYNFADFAVFQTAEAMRFFSARLQRKSAVIPNPAKLIFDGEWNPRGTKKIVTLSRIDLFQKRLDVIVDALALMKVDAKLNIYGGGPQAEVDRLEGYIASSPAKSRISLMGPVISPATAFQDADVYVLCSDCEGIPNSVMEALSYGIPIISTDCSPGGARVLLGCGKYGTIVPCGDAGALAHALDRYFANPNPSIEMARAGVKSVSRFNETAIAQAWLNVFRRAVRNS